MESQSSQQSPKPPFMADLERSFFKSWAPSSSEHVHPVDTSLPPSTPISPMTVLNQRNKKRPSHPSAQSEISHCSLDPQGDEPAPSSCKRPLLSTISVGLPFLKVSRPSATGLNDPNDSGSSSVGNPARKVLSRSTHRSSSHSIGSAEPPREARFGYKWKREISGHWFEIRNRGNRQSDSKLLADSKDSFLDVTKPAGIRWTSRASEAPTGDFILSKADNPLDNTAHPGTDQPGGLLSRAKRRLRLSQTPPPTSNGRAKTFTEEFLERVTAVLRGMSDGQWTPPSTSTSVSNLSSKSIAGWFNGRKPLLPCEDKKSNTHELGHIGTRDEKPHPSPELQSTYTGSDSRQYFCVDITAPDGPTYLPSEACRIKTPPLSDSGSGRALRGFFLEHHDQTKPFIESSSDSVKDFSNDQGQQRRKRSSTVDYYRVQLAASEMMDAQERHQFELNVPEHLPNSPLCPRNPKHPSGGKGMCLYHGRNKLVSVE